MSKNSIGNLSIRSGEHYGALISAGYASFMKRSAVQSYVDQLAAVTVAGILAPNIEATNNFSFAISETIGVREGDFYVGLGRGGISAYRKHGAGRIGEDALKGVACNVLGRWVSSAVVTAIPGPTA